ncbi:MAG: sulfite exporter TauE/SafE family protein, partial [candidate division NC10 bacterium]
FLILFLGIPTHIALGTSHFILCISSGSGLVMFTIMGNVEVDFMMPIALGAILGARIGAEFARRTRADILRRMLAAVVLIVAFRMFLRGLGK